MGFVDINAIDEKQLREGIKSRIISGEKIMMAFMEVAPGLNDPGHSHPHEQCGIVLEGELEMTIGDEVKLIRKGDAYFIPGGQPHGARTKDKSCKVLDIFSPPREEYK